MYQLIGGQERRGSGGEQPLVDPSTGEELGIVDLASTEDVDAAVAAAGEAYSEWSRLPHVERATIMHKAADILDGQFEELAQAETAECGKAIRLCREFDVPGSIDNARFFAGAARHLTGMASAEYSGEHTSTIRREPIGVVGSIAPWNYPLQMAAWKVLPAIAAGNTIVLKPSELTPTTSLIFAKAFHEAGAPAGTVNVVTGNGPDAGAHLMRHEDVSMVSFTGSTRVGRTVLEAAATNAKRVHLELGGKAPFVVFDDADLEAAIHGAVAGSLINVGQDCTAATRAIVHRSVLEDFVAGVADLFGQVVIGPTRDEATDMGSLISFDHRDKVAGMVERARGYATVVCGGEAPQSGDLANGAYYRPTLITDAAPDSEIVRDEIFGPVLVVLPFDDDDEAICLANDTPYGLAASAWTTDLGRAGRASREIQAGCVWINDHIPIISEMPHGGYKQSGFGKDMSHYSFEEYTQVKHVMTDITGAARKEWHRTIFTT